MFQLTENIYCTNVPEFAFWPKKSLAVHFPYKYLTGKFCIRSCAIYVMLWDLQCSSFYIRLNIKLADDS